MFYFQEVFVVINKSYYFRGKLLSFDKQVIRYWNILEICILEYSSLMIQWLFIMT